MEIKKVCKNHFICALFFAVCFAAVFAAGFWRGCTYSESNNTDSERAERYKDRNESAQKAVSELESGLSDVAKQMHGIGRKIDESITDVGEFREVSGRIAGAGSDVENSACRIEEGIQRIEQILYEAEKEGCVLENCSRYSGNSNSD